MRIAALGDIHGNYAALKAALHRIESENARVTLFMGDYVSDCAEPRETLDLIAQYAKTHDCRFVRGNREQYMLDYRGDGGHNSARGAARFRRLQNVNLRDSSHYSNALNKQSADKRRV